MSGRTIQLRYCGDRRVQATHVRSGAVIHTDAPADNRGLGRSFSPTDLLAASVASCAITVASLIAAEAGVEIGAVTVDVYKVMAASPRRLARLDLTVCIPPGMPEAALRVLGARIRDTPVARSLASDVEVRVRLVATEVESVTAVFRVEGMTCGGCESAIRTTARRLDGVHEVQVDHAAGTARVRYDPSRITAEAIAAAITELGYPTSVGASEPAAASAAAAGAAPSCDPEMARICQAGCAAKYNYDPAGVVAQPGARVGDLTRCPVSRVVFEVQADQPSLVRNGQTWFTCCRACMEKLEAYPAGFLRGRP